MENFKTANVAKLGFLFFMLEAVLPRNAAAYVDPGTTGMLSQMLYILFYGALGLFFYCLRYVKRYIVNLKECLVRYFGGKT